MAMTAAEHFEKAEELLTSADQAAGNTEVGQALGIRAQAHLWAAQLLLDAEKLLIIGNAGSPSIAVDRTGLTAIVEKRRS